MHTEHKSILGSKYHIKSGHTNASSQLDDEQVALN